MIPRVTKRTRPWIAFIHTNHQRNRCLSSTKVPPSPSFNTQNTYDYESTIPATPVIFNPKPCGPGALLTPFRLLDTVSILNPKLWHISPCLGAAMTTAPFVGNMLRLFHALPEEEEYTELRNSNSSTQLRMDRVARLAGQLFFQMIREASIQLTKTKSMPAYFLNPKLIAAILAHSLFSPHSTIQQDEICRMLKEDFGIKSNYIRGDQWTGISMSRWMGLFHCSQSQGHFDWMVLAIWQVALWEVCHSKDCLLDFLLEFDRYMVAHNNGESIFIQDDDFVNALRKNDSVARQEWVSRSFTDSDFSSTNVQTSLDKLMFYSAYLDVTGSKSNYSEYARALEVVCSSIALQQAVHTSKPTVPNGYYGYDGGYMTADCAEATVREILDLLLWNENTNSFDLSRLPITASKDLIKLYEGNSEVSEDIEYERGQQWFNLLSDIPGCDYLSSSPNGKPYELAPAIQTLSKACHRVLMDGEESRSTNNELTEWTTLADLSDDWVANKVRVHEEVLTHSTSTSNELIRHEFATLQLEGSLNALEIRMRCDFEENSGFAAVTHLRQRRKLFEPEQIRSLRALMEKEYVTKQSPWLRILALVLVGDIGLLRFPVSSTSNADIDLLTSDLLSASFGCDRRGLYALGDNEEFLQKQLFESEAVLTAAISKLCQVVQEQRKDAVHSPCLVDLLSWILRESPVVVESTLHASYSMSDPSIESMVLGLPPEILSLECIQDALNLHWACQHNGKVMLAMAQWKEGHSPFPSAVRELDWREWISFISLCSRSGWSLLLGGRPSSKEVT